MQPLTIKNERFGYFYARYKKFHFFCKKMHKKKCHVTSRDTM